MVLDTGILVVVVCSTFYIISCVEETRSESSRISSRETPATTFILHSLTVAALFPKNKTEMASTATAKRHVLIYGANGALGRSIVSHFKAKNWIITSLDFTANSDAHFDIQLPKGGLAAKDAFAAIKDKVSASSKHSTSKASWLRGPHSNGSERSQS